MDVYLVTRPIQYVNVLNLPFEIKGAVLLLQNNFSTFELLYNIAKQDKKRWSKIETFDTNCNIFKWLFCNYRFIDNFVTYSDLGVRWYILFNLFRRKTNIYLYEEGLASYSNHTLCKQKKVIYSFLNKCIMSEIHLGAHNKVKKIFVYDIRLHNKLIPSAIDRVCGFKYPLEIILSKEHLQPMLYNKQDKYKGKNVFLYLTSWTYNKSICNYIPPNKECIRLIKPHPKLLLSNDILSIFDEVIDVEFIAEIVISNLLNVVNHLTVIHEGSTSMLHFIPNDKLSEICLSSDTSLSYEHIKKIIIQLSRNKVS